jgi:hypothetical protein
MLYISYWSLLLLNINGACSSLIPSRVYSDSIAVTATLRTALRT